MGDSQAYGCPSPYSTDPSPPASRATGLVSSAASAASSAATELDPLRGELAGLQEAYKSTWLELVEEKARRSVLEGAMSEMYDLLQRTGMVGNLPYTFPHHLFQQAHDAMGPQAAAPWAGLGLPPSSYTVHGHEHHRAYAHPGQPALAGSYGFLGGRADLSQAIGTPLPPSPGVVVGPGGQAYFSAGAGGQRTR